MSDVILRCRACGACVVSGTEACPVCVLRNELTGDGRAILAVPAGPPIRDEETADLIRRLVAQLDASRPLIRKLRRITRERLVEIERLEAEVTRRGQEIDSLRAQWERPRIFPLDAL